MVLIFFVTEKEKSDDKEEIKEEEDEGEDRKAKDDL